MKATGCITIWQSKTMAGVATVNGKSWMGRFNSPDLDQVVTVAGRDEKDVRQRLLEVIGFALHAIQQDIVPGSLIMETSAVITDPNGSHDQQWANPDNPDASAFWAEQSPLLLPEKPQKTQKSTKPRRPNAG